MLLCVDNSFMAVKIRYLAKINLFKQEMQEMQEMQEKNYHYL